MSLIDTVKDTVQLAQDINNMPLLKQLVELQQQVFDSCEEKQKLKEENRNLRAKLDLREKHCFDKNFYWVIDGDKKDGPFCVKCYEADRVARRMVDFGNFFGCPTCEFLLTRDGDTVSVHERKRFKPSLKDVTLVGAT